jgi:hypothetical protein
MQYCFPKKASTTIIHAKYTYIIHKVSKSKLFSHVKRIIRLIS